MTYGGMDLSFEVDAPGWRGTQFADGVELVRQGNAGGIVTMTHFVGDLFTDPCSADGTTKVEVTAQALIDGLVANRELRAEAPVAVKLAGSDGIQLDVSADVPPACPDRPRIWLWALPVVGDFHIDEQEVARFIAADIDDKAAVVIVESFAGGDHASLIEAAEPIVSSITSP